MKKDDLKICLESGVLNISTEKKETKENNAELLYVI
jgi:hypothetical protein